MVYFYEYDVITAFKPFDTRLFENQRHGVVSSSDGLSYDCFYLRRPSVTPDYKKAVSIVICTYGRPESLNETLTSLTKQTFKDFEVILITEKGDLSSLRDTGLRHARGDIVSFIDDDVYCPPTWLESIVKGFREGVVGVSGPTEIPTELKSNRDIFKYKRFKKLHDFLFLDGKASFPGYLSSSGTPSLAASDNPTPYEGEVMYLEACNMAVRRDAAIKAGGFDKNFINTSEWCEVDLGIRLASKGCLSYLPSAHLKHLCSKAGVYSSRLNTKHRWKNFIYFQKKWEGECIKIGLRTYAYRAWVWIYLWMKNKQMI